jgi:hypothetical protein
MRIAASVELATAPQFDKNHKTLMYKEDAYKLVKEFISNKKKL